MDTSSINTLLTMHCQLLSNIWSLEKNSTNELTTSSLIPLRLALGKRFNKPITILPSSLKHLTIGSITSGFKFHKYESYFTHPLDYLPPSLTHLHMFEAVSTKFPTGLTYLTLSGYTIHKCPILPPNLTHLTLSGAAREISCLPATLTHLVFRTRSVGVTDLDSYQPRILYGKIGNYWGHFDQCLDNLLPLLTHLVLPTSFSRPVDNLPLSLVHLSFHSYTDMPLYRPRCLEFIFNQPVDQLPPNLTFLTGPCIQSPCRPPTSTSKEFEDWKTLQSVYCQPSLLYHSTHTMWQFQSFSCTPSFFSQMVFFKSATYQRRT